VRLKIAKNGLQEKGLSASSHGKRTYMARTFFLSPILYFLGKINNLPFLFIYLQNIIFLAEKIKSINFIIRVHHNWKKINHYWRIRSFITHALIPHVKILRVS